MSNKTAKKINRPRISNWIGGFYAATTVLIALLFACLAFQIGMLLPLLGTGVLVSAILSVTTYCFYRTKYVIDGGILYSWSPFANIRLKISDIRKVERTRVPVYLRVGASLYSGLFYIAGAGWTKTIMTNLTDGVLITDSKGKHYLITPSNPDEFVKLLK